MKNIASLAALAWHYLWSRPLAAVLNLLLLNFSYHNAHHERPIEPWYRLPALHARLYPGEHHQTLPMTEHCPDDR